MKFLCAMMMNEPRGKGDWGAMSWPPEDLKAYAAYMAQFAAALKNGGKVDPADEHALLGEARVVRAGKGGTPEVTDGPFPEPKDFMAGYFIIDVESVEQAYAIAARASAAPGPRGVPLNLAIEVRELISTPPVDS